MNRQKCNRKCGKCCKSVIVFLKENEITKLSKAGYNKKVFVSTFGPRKNVYRLNTQPNGDCIFLEKDKRGIYSCKVYPIRPETCVMYPTGKCGEFF